MIKNRMMRRRLFNASWLIVALPVYFFYQQLNPQPSAHTEERLLNDTVGPWSLVLTASTPPHAGPNRTWLREYELHCQDCGETLKAAALSANRPEDIADGTLCRGGPRFFDCELSFSASDLDHESLWLLLEAWSGEQWQARVR